MRLRLAHLYPREMNLYGDTGNVLAIRQRLVWLGHSCELVPVEVGAPVDLSGVDLVVGGGGPDAAQRHVGPDLLRRRGDVSSALAAGVPMLLVCGMYQLFGTSFRTGAGEVLRGIGVFDAETVTGSHRPTGELVVDSPFGCLTGYENHAGLTRLGPSQQPLGTVRSGTGNGGEGRTEGAVTGSAIGTYLHGPVLPRNPALADHLILQALRRRDSSAELSALDVDGPRNEIVLGPRKRLGRPRLRTAAGPVG